MATIVDSILRTEGGPGSLTLLDEPAGAPAEVSWAEQIGRAHV